MVYCESKKVKKQDRKKLRSGLTDIVRATLEYVHIADFNEITDFHFGASVVL